MALVLDAGALIAIERRDRNVIARLVAAHEAVEPVRTSTAAVSQVWRDGTRQATLARVLRGVEEADIDSTQAREIGQLLRTTKSSDVVDAAIALIAQSGDEILTSDPSDIKALVQVRRVNVVSV